MNKLDKKIAAVNKHNSDYSANGETPKPLATVFTSKHERIAMRAFKVSLAILGATLLTAAWTVFM